MSIKPVQKRKVVDEVLDQMKDQILSGTWSPGMKIPGEMELTRMFGVSRVSVREAIHRLVGMGILTIRHGGGTYIAEILPRDYFNALLPALLIESVSLGELLEFREMVEVESARHAATRATPEDIGRMRDILGAMQRHEGDHLRFALEDLNFHTALALATQNSVIVKVNAIMHDMLKKAMEEIVVRTGFQGGMHYHARILEAVEKRDPETAMQVMREHIRTTIERVADL
jgi:GntR family transcriptional regulator, transcriptional repressor for pyruvate dehydrogenase complex